MKFSHDRCNRNTFANCQFRLNGRFLRMTLVVRMGHFEKRKLDGFELTGSQMLLNLRRRLTFDQIIFRIAHVPRFTAVHHARRTGVILSVKLVFRPEEVVALLPRFAFAHTRLLGPFHQCYRRYNFNRFNVVGVFGVVDIDGAAAADGAVIA